MRTGQVIATAATLAILMVSAVGAEGPPPAGAGAAATRGGAAVRNADLSPAPPHLWDWVRLEMGLHAATPPPMMAVVSPAELFLIRHGRAVRLDGDLEVHGLYDREGGRILLAAPHDPADPLSQSIVVHELVHHAQAVTGRTFACPAEAEKQAYGLQEKWLRGFGHDLESVGVGGLTLLLLTHCGL